jgi:hypothetical protein
VVVFYVLFTSRWFGVVRSLCWSTRYAPTLTEFGVRELPRGQMKKEHGTEVLVGTNEVDSNISATFVVIGFCPPRPAVDKLHLLVPILFH